MAWVLFFFGEAVHVAFLLCEYPGHFSVWAKRSPNT